MKLTRKQEVFVYEYLKDFNAGKAAIRAGYSHEDLGRQLLMKSHIREKIEEELKKRQQEHLATVESIIKELSSVAFSDIFRLVDIDKGILRLKDKTQLKDIDTRAVASISYDGKTGTIKIKMHDKLKALELLGKHLGLFEGEKPDREQLTQLKELIESLKNDAEQI